MTNNMLDVDMFHGHWLKISVRCIQIQMSPGVREFLFLLYIPINESVYLSVLQGTLVCVWESFRLRRLRILFSL